MKKLLSLCSFILILSGCVNLAVTSAQATYNRYNISNSFRDQYTTLQADHAIHWYSEDFKNVSVSTFNGVVVITGQVQDEAKREEVEKRVKDVPEVDKVYNLTTVANTPSTLTEMSDAWITTKIKTQLIAQNEIDPSKIKVITEDGTVYLIGIVFPEQAEIATDIARSTSGVQRVVKVFSYLKITKVADP